MIGLEVCVDTLAGLEVAASLRIARIELCGALAVGGISPPVGLIAAARGCPVPVHVMIRPRGGSFVFSIAEVAAMEAEIAAVREAGLAGVVLGASLPNDRLDEAVLKRLAEAAGGLERTLHRVIDLTPDLPVALEIAAGLGFTRVLTSGGATHAAAGAATLARLVRASGGRIAVMAGGGITPGNVAALIGRTGVTTVHASCRETIAADARLAAFGFGSGDRVTSRTVVAEMLDVLDRTTRRPA